MAASGACNKQLEDLKSTVRSILLPSKDGLMLRSFEHEYVDLVGQPLHYRQLGFGRLEDLLASMPDAVQLIRLNTGELLLKAVTSKSTEHIAAFVNRQKPSENSASRAVKAAKNAEFRAHNYRVQGTKLIPAEVQKQVKEVLKKYPNGLRLSEFLDRFYQLHCVQLNIREYGYESVDEFFGELSKNLVRIRPIGRSGELEVVPKEELVQQWKLEARPQTSGATTHSDARAQPTSNGFGTEIEEISIPPKLRESLTRLIEKHSNGLWMQNLLREYKDEYKCDFDYASSGCISMIEFCAKLPSIFKVVPASKNGSELMLFPASVSEPRIVGPQARGSGLKASESGIPDAVKSNLARVLQQAEQVGGVPLERLVRVYTETIGQVLDVSAYDFHNLVDFLKVLDFVQIDCKSGKDGNPHLVVRSVAPRTVQAVQPVQAVAPAVAVDRQARYPQDALLGNPIAIAEQELPAGLKVGDTFDVEAGEVVNPGHFYVQLRGAHHSEAVKELMRSMDKYYDGIASNHLRVPTSVPPVGNFFAAEYQTFGWHRVFVTKMLDPDHADVFFIDYGTREKKALKELRLLHEQFCRLPAQALQARLAGIRPPRGGTKWSVDSALKFFELIQKCGDIGQVAVLKGFKREKSRILLSLDLYDTSSELVDVFMNDVLLSNDLAEVDGNAAQNDDYRGDLPYVEPVSAPEPMQPLRLPNRTSFHPLAGAVDPKPVVSATKQELPPGLPPLHVPPPPVVSIVRNAPARSTPEASVTQKSASAASWQSSKAESDSHSVSEVDRASVRVTAMPLPDGASVHVVAMRNKFYVNSMEISLLIPKFKRRDLLSKFLDLKGLKYDSLIVNREECIELFEEFLCENVPGIEVNDSLVDKLRLYSLFDVAHLVQTLDPNVPSSLVSALETTANTFQK